MAKLTAQELIAAIKELTVLELNDLVKACEAEFGVSAAAGLDTDRYTGTFLWQFCDSRTYVSCASQCRTSGFNNKGMVTGGRMPTASWHAVGKVIKEYLNKQ